MKATESHDEFCVVSGLFRAPVTCVKGVVLIIGGNAVVGGIWVEPRQQHPRIKPTPCWALGGVSPRQLGDQGPHKNFSASYHYLATTRERIGCVLRVPTV